MSNEHAHQIYLRYLQQHEKTYRKRILTRRWVKIVWDLGFSDLKFTWTEPLKPLGSGLKWNRLQSNYIYTQPFSCWTTIRYLISIQLKDIIPDNVCLHMRFFPSERLNILINPFFKLGESYFRIPSFMIRETWIISARCLWHLNHWLGVWIVNIKSILTNDMVLL